MGRNNAVNALCAGGTLFMDLKLTRIDMYTTEKTASADEN